MPCPDINPPCKRQTSTRLHTLLPLHPSTNPPPTLNQPSSNPPMLSRSPIALGTAPHAPSIDTSAAKLAAPPPPPPSPLAPPAQPPRAEPLY
eukprot:1176455-Prorocentrum_minimum.AAC.1